MKKLISVVIPAYNEQEVLPACFERITALINSCEKYDFEILTVDDGSSDKTAEIAKKQREKDGRFSYLTLSRNFGKESAMLAGTDYAKGDAVIFIDADLQDPPELIPELISYWEQGYDDVYARRRSRDGESFFKKWSASMYYRILQKLTRVKIQIDTGDFRLLDRRCVNALKKIRESSRNTKSLFSWIGYRKKEVFYDRDRRAAGTTKWNYRRLFELAVDGITSFTVSPLKIASYFSVLPLTASLAYFIYIVISGIVKSGISKADVAIWLVLLFFGIQFLLIGILGEYVGRAFGESKKRPQYLVDEYNGEKEMNENL